MDLLLTGFLMSPVALIVILVIALLIFGKRLPEVARSLGKGIVEFKKGVKGVEDEIERPLPPPQQYPQNQYGQQYGAPYQPPAYQNPPYPQAASTSSDPSQPYGGQAPSEQKPV